MISLDTTLTLLNVSIANGVVVSTHRSEKGSPEAV